VTIVRFRGGKDVMELLERLDNKLSYLIQREAHMAGELDRLTKEVAETKTVIDSAITLLGQLAQLIRDNAGNPTALNALADDLDAKQNELAKAITDNTPTV